MPPTDAGKAAPALELEGLTKVFIVGRSGARVVAVNDVSFTIGRGEVLGLVGESGSGKSTIARLISRLHDPSGGATRMDGQDVPLRLSGSALRQFRRNVQMIFQDPFASLNPLHTIGYIVGRPLQIHGLARGREVRGKVNTLLERVGLSPGNNYIDKRPHELSGGQRQRVVIARALAAKPTLILADEPTSALDVSIRLDIMNLLLDLRDQEGLSMLFITHDLAGARYMSDRVAVMYAGHLVEIGPAEAVIGAPQMPYTQLLKSAAPKPEGNLSGGVEARGEVPDLKDLPPGCPFEPRCPHARPVCSEGLPRMYDVGERHQARCILHDPVLAAQPPLRPEAAPVSDRLVRR
ncbi:peptide/nickel transport system ATP-binding protein [Deinococcus reticulitermitis]|uniref:Peptide/nickel transport system ATP-binding protein n=1 Tax=Deinococcus reticulitermitis TaxID=856736 RepID=A0A1H7C1Y2_9DEIO|nr:ABC transporter ATP-binding protein [Deinococcus reticulitermitis]SEJ83658.1 peptide/nickel transport system ATP-binding protein [Deinococcus reticulitermitis]